MNMHIFNGSTVSINADGKLYQYSLSKNAEYKVSGAIGITTILIHDGKVRITDSPCHNKTCIHQKDANTIICLPNKVIVKVNAKEKEEFDGMSQ